MNSKTGHNCWAQLLIPGIAVYILLGVAIFNGYPLTFPDTGEYLVDSFTLEVPLYRTIFYPIFMRVTSFGITPWLVVIAQSAITVFVLYQCVNFAIGHRMSPSFKNRALLGVALGMAIVTTLPWSVGELMPDVFAGLLILCIFLLLYDSELSTQTSIALALVVAVSIACHLSHLLISGLILLAVAVLRIFRTTREFWPTRERKQIALFLLVPILAGASAVGLSNLRAGMGFTLSGGGRMFLVARLFASGLAGGYLQRSCQVKHLAACEYLGNLPADETQFLWRDNPVFNAMGGWTRSKQEANDIIFGTIEQSPGRFLWECARQALRQFLTMKPGVQNAPYPLFLVKNFQRFYPGDIPKMEVSKQSTGGLKKLSNLVSSMDVVVFWCSLGCCLGLFGLRRRQLGTASKLFVFALIALLCNALVTGALANVTDRYQSRVCWLMVFCGISYLLTWLAQRQQKFTAVGTTSRREVQSFKPRDAKGSAQGPSAREAV